MEAHIFDPSSFHQSPAVSDSVEFHLLTALAYPNGSRFDLASKILDPVILIDRAAGFNVRYAPLSHEDESTGMHQCMHLSTGSFRARVRNHKSEHTFAMDIVTTARAERSCLPSDHQFFFHSGKETNRNGETRPSAAVLVLKIKTVAVSA